VLVINASFPVLPTERIHRVRFALGAQVFLNRRIRVSSEGLLYVDVSSPLPGHSLHVDGHIKLNQVGLITQGFEYHYMDPVFRFDDFSWPSLISAYQDRDCMMISSSSIRLRVQAHLGNSSKHRRL
jgi:hypothetical protein